MIRTYRPPARDAAALSAAVQRWCQDHLHYLRETPETYVSPLRTLKWGVGDCDDFTILEAAALRGARIPISAVFVGWAPGGTRGRIDLRHVYPRAWTGSGWRSLEAVRRVPFGWDAAKERARRGERVRVVIVGDHQGEEPDAG